MRNRVSQFFGRWNIFAVLARIQADVITIKENQVQHMADTSKLEAVATKLATDFTALDTDVRAFIASHPATDPAEQATIDRITTALDSIDTGVQALDSAAKPSPAGGGSGQA